MRKKARNTMSDTIKKTKKNYDEKCVEISTRKVIVNDSIEHPIVASNIL